MSSSEPPPLLLRPRVPVAVRLAVVLWVLSALAAAAALAAAVVGRESQRAKLTDRVAALDTSWSGDRATELAGWVFWGCLGAVALLVLVAVLLLPGLRRGKPRASLRLFVVLVLQVGVALVVSGLLTAADEPGRIFRYALAAQLLLATTAWALGLAPRLLAWAGGRT